MNESNRARIPVRPLPYSDRDLAMTRELVIDYDKGNIYITDKDDPTMLIDITKLIADSYLSNINGDKTNVTINGEVYNLADILTELKQNKITILNSADTQAVPASVNYDHNSVSIKDNMVSLYGFTDAPNFSTPMKKDNVLVWLTPEDSGDPSEPTPGANINVIDISPTNDYIILYNKPFQYTKITTSPRSNFLIKLPLSMPKFSRLRWKIDTDVQLSLSFPSNIIWIDDDIMATPVQKLIAAGHSYLIDLETWDFGTTWMVTTALMFPLYAESAGTELPPNQTYLVDDGGALIAESENVLLVTGENTNTASVAATYKNGVMQEVPTIMPKTSEAVSLMLLGAPRAAGYYIKKITDLTEVDNVDSSADKIFLNKDGAPVQAPADAVATKVSSANDVPYTNNGVNSVAEALDKLLHTPTTVTFSYSAPIVQQKGVVLRSWQLRWEFSKEVKSISINGTNLAPTTRAYTESVDLSANKTYTFVYSDGVETYTKTVTVKFLNGIYYGVSASTDYNTDLINSLTRKLQENNKIDFSVNAGDGQYIYYACPVSYGQPVFIINGLEVVYDKMIDFDYINTDGYSERYAIYRSTYPGLGLTKITSK